MKGSKVGKQILTDTLETLESQLAKPILNEAISQFGGFVGYEKRLSRRPTSLAQEDLKRARSEQEIKQMNESDNNQSEAHAGEVLEHMREFVNHQYQQSALQNDREQQELRSEFLELQEEVAKLAETAGVQTKAHLENPPTKIGLLDIRRLTFIVRYLRIKAEESKSAMELVDERQEAKTTGMLAWVSGKQMKIHEQGTLTLQG